MLCRAADALLLARMLRVAELSSVRDRRIGLVNRCSPRNCKQSGAVLVSYAASPLAEEARSPLTYQRWIDWSYHTPAG